MARATRDTTVALQEMVEHDRLEAWFERRSELSVRMIAAQWALEAEDVPLTRARLVELAICCMRMERRLEIMRNQMAALERRLRRRIAQLHRLRRRIAAIPN